MNDYLFNLTWNIIKEQLWIPFNEKQVFIDENENILALKKDDGSIEVIGYLYLSDRVKIFSQDQIISFIGLIKTIAKTKWQLYEIKLITNFPLHRISSSILKKLPEDIKYYLLYIEKDISFFDGEDGLPDWDFKYKFKGINLQNVEYQIKQSIFYEKLNNISSSKHRNDNDSEELIMRALRNGDGDLYGL